MAFDLAWLKFGGFANTVAIEEFQGSFDQEGDELTLRKSLYSEYVQDGRPTDQRVWLRPHLATLFQCLGPRPKWIEKSPIWPFLGGKPMTFIGQMDVPANQVSVTRLSPDTTIYIFGARVPAANDTSSWQTHHQVVTQHQSLAGL